MGEPVMNEGRKGRLKVRRESAVAVLTAYVADSRLPDVFSVTAAA